MDIFGSSGTRGVANQEITPEFAVRLAKAVGTAWDTDRVCVGRDTRTTSQMITDAVVSGLASCGLSVDRLGIIPTPGVQSYAATEGIPGVMITASHNPPEYNGMKLIGDDGIELSLRELTKIEDVFFAEEFDIVAWDNVGTVSGIESTDNRYLEELLAGVDVESIRATELTVALDPGHGTGTLVTPRFLRELGCRVVTVNADLDGRFPGRNPEPVKENLSGLRRLVRASDANVGVAHDGDADRAIFIDEQGEFIEGDAALAALARPVVESGDVVVSAVNVSQRLTDIVTASGGDVEMTPIGSTRIITRIRELQQSDERVPIAGEGNGGVIFPDHRLNRDGAYTAAKFLELLAEEPASAIAGSFGAYANARMKLAYDSIESRKRLLEAAGEYAEGTNAEVTTIDGYRLDFRDAWVLVRASGTEPLIRIYAEAGSSSAAEELAESVYTYLKDAINIPQ